MSANFLLHSVGRSLHYERGFLPFLAAICTIGIDHKKYLGTTRRQLSSCGRPVPVPQPATTT